MLYYINCYIESVVGWSILSIVVFNIYAGFTLLDNLCLGILENCRNKL